MPMPRDIGIIDHIQRMFDDFGVKAETAFAPKYYPKAIVDYAKFLRENALRVFDLPS